MKDCAECVQQPIQCMACLQGQLEKAEREIEEVRSAVCADDTETTVEAALHLAQAAEKKGQEVAFTAALRVGPNDIVLVRSNLGDLPPHVQRHHMRRVRTDLLELLEREGVRHSGVIMLAPGWELSAVSRDQLRALLDGDKVERAQRMAVELRDLYETTQHIDLDALDWIKESHLLLEVADNARACAEET